MKILKKIIKLGDSKVITLPKIISEKLIPGQVYCFDIELVDEPIEKIAITYKCKVCQHSFSVEKGDDIYCTACGSEAVKRVKGGIW